MVSVVPLMDVRLPRSAAVIQPPTPEKFLPTIGQFPRAHKLSTHTASMSTPTLLKRKGALRPPSRLLTIVVLKAKTSLQ